jgi:hypothetical protein
MKKFGFLTTFLLVLAGTIHADDDPGVLAAMLMDADTNQCKWFSRPVQSAARPPP